MVLETAVLASGSSGNSIYVSDEEVSLLIDAGLSGKKIENKMRTINRDPGQLDALLLTHEHNDHISGAGVMCRRYNIPIYASSGTMTGGSAQLGSVPDNFKNTISSGETWELGNFRVSTFALPHDAEEPLGYIIQRGDIKLGLATDIGCVTPEIEKKLNGADILFLESNHDQDLLRTGSYPPHLKRRIRSKKGHLSNIEAASLLPRLLSAEKNIRPLVILSHLSEENNRPELAYITIKNSLSSAGWQVGEDINLTCASRQEVSKLYRKNFEGGISKTG